jgi:hypothetical protein
MPVIVTVNGLEQYLTRQQEKLMVVKKEAPVSNRYVHQDYPRWVKGLDGKKTLCKTEAEEQELLAKWQPAAEKLLVAPALVEQQFVDGAKKFFGGKKGRR